MIFLVAETQGMSLNFQGGESAYRGGCGSSKTLQVVGLEII